MRCSCYAALRAGGFFEKKTMTPVVGTVEVALVLRFVTLDT